MPLARVDDEERELPRKLDPAPLERAAVEEQCLSFAPEQRCSLVEDAGGHADRSLLGTLTGPREVEWLKLEVRDRAERECHDYLQRSRGAEAGPAREIRFHDTLEADRRTTELGQPLGDSRDVATPASRVAGPVRVQVHRFPLGDEGDPLRGPGGQLDTQMDRDRQDEPAAVVRVLPDEIDAPRCPETLRHAILNLVKVAFIGAGSTVFAKTLIADLFSYPELAGDMTIALMDIDEERLRTSELVARKIAESAGARARIEVSADRRTVLTGADYVLTMMQVGGYRPATVTDFELPKDFGLRQTIGDTLGIGGIMRALRTIPVVLDVCQDMEELCPDALLLQYVNPMAMLGWAVARASSISTIGLCHSVQGTAGELEQDLALPPGELEYVCAGINHLSFYLELSHRGRDMYPELRAKEDFPEWNRVRYEILRHFGYFCTESSEHLAEYVPWFIKQGRPEVVEEFNVPLDEYPRRCELQIAEWEELRRSLEDGVAPATIRSNEYGARIVHALETGESFTFNANVMNDGLIDNLPECCVEVPCVADERGVSPQPVGALPPQLAGLIQTNVNVQALTVEAALTGKREHVYHAAMLDPHTAAELPLAEIHELVDRLLEAHGELVPALR